MSGGCIVYGQSNEVLWSARVSPLSARAPGASGANWLVVSLRVFSWNHVNTASVDMSRKPSASLTSLDYWKKIKSLSKSFTPSFPAAVLTFAQAVSLSMEVMLKQCCIAAMVEYQSGNFISCKVLF